MGSFSIRSARLAAVAAMALAAGSALAQTPRASPPPPAKGAPATPQPSQAQQQQQPAPPKPYKPLAVKLPTPADDPSFAAFRQQLGGVATKRDRPALGKMMAKTFFWEAETGDKSDKKKSPLDNLSAAIGLAGKEPVGWDLLASAAQDPTLETAADRPGVMCGPGSPQIDDAAFEQLIKDTGADAGEWAYATRPDAQIFESSRPGARVVGKLPPNLVRVYPEPQAAPAKGAPPPSGPPAIRIVLPGGEFGYVGIDAISPVVFDQLCYMKEGNAWKIAGYIGSDQ